MRAVFLSLGLAFAHTACAIDMPAALDFERVFSTLGEPAALHYKALYQDAHGLHELEVWREGQHRLRRRTDQALDVLAVREQDEEMKLTVLDHARRMRADVSRTSLYRVGHFADWFGLAHGIRKPASAYVLTRLRHAPSGEAPSLPCRWYALASGQQHSTLCWSSTFRLPIMMGDASGPARWKIVLVETGILSPTAFQTGDTGYIRVNADEDMRSD